MHKGWMMIRKHLVSELRRHRKLGKLHMESRSQGVYRNAICGNKCPGNTMVAKF